MIAERLFMMGEFEARFPTDRLYGKNHMWCHEISTSMLRFGLTAYAVRLLQDVYFLDITIEPGMQLSVRQEIGSIESKKAESSLYCPTAGTVAAVNEALLDDPTAINLDKYGDGWLFALEGESAKTSDLLSPDAYIEHLDAAWQIAQRTIKGQTNA